MKLSVSNSQWKKIDEIIDEIYKRKQPPGLAIGFFNKNGLMKEKYFGYGNIEEKNKVNENTGFMVGSITKLFTLVAIMQQFEEGKFELDDNVNDFLPNGKIITKKGWPEVNFKHILTHTSGIGELRSKWDLFKKGFRLITYDDEKVPPMSSLHDLPVYSSSPAGYKYAYSNIAISILGYIIEKLTSLSFRDYLIKNVLDPLEMTNSDLIKSNRIKLNEALGYKYKNGTYKQAKRWNNIIKPSGALVTSVRDMANFGKMLLNHGQYNGKRILRPETLELIWSPHYYAHEELRDRYSIGLIFRLHLIDSMRLVEHTGGLSGFNAQFSLFPDNDFGFYSFCNLNEGMHNRTTSKLRNRIIKVLIKDCKRSSLLTNHNKRINTEYEGFYGPFPGFLTNTRIFIDGIEFKVKEKRDHFVFSSLIGSKKIGFRLFQTAKPEVFFKKNKPDEDIYMNRKYVFSYSESESNYRLSQGLFTYRKLKYYQTIPFKITILCFTIFLITLLSIVIYLSL
ncbi:MAG: serine hydrolase [Candidatus Lokiarchaeota archaeon]|nr:serine hydrolase [Candidatus Lokiarchaeota archaeon]MBD3199733.1 serine hydrolase [Candidatus Lokiarchaeota archaeon]